WSAAQGLVLALVVTALCVGDTIANRDRRIPFGIIIPVQVAAAEVGRLAHLDVAYVGVVMCVAAVVWTGLAAIAGDRWRLPLQLTAAVSIVAGVALSLADPAALGIA